MRILVTGSAGHLGEALVRSVGRDGDEVVGLDVRRSPFTDLVGSIADRGLVREAVAGADAVLHTATLHKPHVVTHARQDFVDTNVTGTLNLLEEAASAGTGAFVLTSTTSVFGASMRPAAGCPAVWVTEGLPAAPTNVYGVTKLAAEGLCRLVARDGALPCVVLRTSRFFPEDDDDRERRASWHGDNLKVNELTFRRVDVADVVSAHRLAMERAPALGFERFVVSAPTPFRPDDVAALADDAPRVLARTVPAYVDVYRRLGWSMLPRVERVYDSTRARERLGWRARHDFGAALARLAAGEDWRSALARTIGSKGYHDERFADGPYPVEGDS